MKSTLNSITLILIVLGMVMMWATFYIPVHIGLMLWVWMLYGIAWGAMIVGRLTGVDKVN